jgi:hypothetical protein
LNDYDGGADIVATHIEGTYSEFPATAIGETIEFQPPSAAAGETAVVVSRLATMLSISLVTGEDTLATVRPLPYLVQSRISGTATNSGSDPASMLRDVNSAFPPDLAGTPVAIIAGTGKGQIRTIDDTQQGGQNYLPVTVDWSPALDDTSRYIVGAIDCQYKSGRIDLPAIQDDGRARQPSSNRAVLVDHEPTSNVSYLNVSLYYDHETTPITFPQSYINGPVTVHAGTDEFEINTRRTRSVLDNAPGLARIPFHGRSEERAIAHRFLAAELQCFQGSEEIVICAMEIEGGA